MVGGGWVGVDGWRGVGWGGGWMGGWRWGWGGLGWVGVGWSGVGGADPKLTGRFQSRKGQKCGNRFHVMTLSWNTTTAWCENRWDYVSHGHPGIWCGRWSGYISAALNEVASSPFERRRRSIGIRLCGLLRLVSAQYACTDQHEADFRLCKKCAIDPRCRGEWLQQVIWKSQSPLTSDAIWRHGSGYIVSAMACCLMALTHYLNQCWLVAS